MSRGFFHLDYTKGFMEFGDPMELVHSKGAVLSRAIPDTPYRDCMGPYPIFCCRDWGGLTEDLSVIARDHVSIVLVTDPFTNPGEAAL